MGTRNPEFLQSALFVVFVIMNYQSHARLHSSAALASCQDSMHVWGSCSGLGYRHLGQPLLPWSCAIALLANKYFLGLEIAYSADCCALVGIYIALDSLCEQAVEERIVRKGGFVMENGAWQGGPKSSCPPFPLRRSRLRLFSFRDLTINRV